jgi:hypothetical protein
MHGRGRKSGGRRVLQHYHGMNPCHLTACRTQSFAHSLDPPPVLPLTSTLAASSAYSPCQSTTHSLQTSPPKIKCSLTHISFLPVAGTSFACPSAPWSTATLTLCPSHTHLPAPNPHGCTAWRHPPPAWASQTCAQWRCWPTCTSLGAASCRCNVATMGEAPHHTWTQQALPNFRIHRACSATEISLSQMGAFSIAGTASGERLASQDQTLIDQLQPCPLA